MGELVSRNNDLSLNWLFSSLIAEIDLALELKA